jgi:hypothetical protein
LDAPQGIPKNKELTFTVPVTPACLKKSKVCAMSLDARGDDIVIIVKLQSPVLLRMFFWTSYIVQGQNCIPEGVSACVSGWIKIPVRSIERHTLKLWWIVLSFHTCDQSFKLVP